MPLGELLMSVLIALFILVIFGGARDLSNWIDKKENKLERFVDRYFPTWLINLLDSMHWPVRIALFFCLLLWILVD
jgi:hypothetical protein